MSDVLARICDDTRRAIAAAKEARPLAELERAAATETHPRNLIALADRIYRWRMEMTHGLDRST